MTVILVKSLKIIFNKQMKQEIKIPKRERKKWDDNKLAVSVDMQKAVMLPKIPGLKVVTFCKRIVLLSETFALIGGSTKGLKEKATGVLWHVAIKGRSAPDVVSNYINYI